MTVFSQSCLSLRHTEDKELTEKKVHFLLTEEHRGGSRNPAPSVLDTRTVTQEDGEKEQCGRLDKCNF